MALVVALCVINVFAIGILIDVGLYNMIDCGSAVLLLYLPVLLQGPHPVLHSNWRSTPLYCS